MMHIVVSLLGLMVALILLFQALGVRSLALGGVVAQKIGFVVLAVICLSAAALADWGANFSAGLTLDQVQLANEGLVIVAMAMLAVYFFAVRTGMKHFIADASALPDSAADGLSAAQPDDQRA